MVKRFCPRTMIRVMFVAGLLMPTTSINAQPANVLGAPGGPPSTPQVEDGWTIVRDEALGVTVRTKSLTLHTRNAPVPALRYRLFPDEFELLPGNAAIHYLKAMGFLEQDPVRRRVYQFLDESRARATENDTGIDHMPPYVWLTTEPGKLPVEEVREYLGWLRFQTPMLREAARRRQFDMDRHLRDADDPVGTLIPEIQVMRELARTQSIRCRLAIAEDRTLDAIEIAGQQFALAAHLGQEEFLVSNLVGVAIATIAWNDVLYLVQHPEAPNLYWALTAMPRPLVSLRRSLAYERHLLYEQVKVLREVNETPRPAAYWSDFIQRFAAQFGSLGSEWDLPRLDGDPEMARMAMTAFVASAYPGAKRYLIERGGIPHEQVESYPTAQVVFLAMKYFHDHWRDEHFKWTGLPLWKSRSKSPSGTTDEAMRAESEQYGWFTLPTQLFLPAVNAAQLAEGRSDQMLAMLMTIEAIRMYAADHDGELPPTLEDLAVPTLNDPLTGNPFTYERHEDQAELSGHPLPGLQYRFIVRIAHDK